jgi:muramoyltetrapeptide carboxypeptidase
VFTETETRSGFLRPKRLAEGDRVAVVAPSGPVPEHALEAGASVLRGMGLRPEWSAGLLARHGYFAGEDSRRREEWEQAWRDPQTHGIIAARGGTGAARLLPLAALDDPGVEHKVFCGFSDLTFLHAALQARRRVSFYGPMVAWDLARGADQPGGFDRRSFEHLLLAGEPGGKLVATGAAALRGGRAEGRLAGGCLSLISATIGTSEAPSFDGAIVVLEDEKEASYRIDRYLDHLRRSGALRGARAIALGQFPDCPPEFVGAPSALEIAREFFDDFPGPVLWGLPIGHTNGSNWTIPLGTWAALDAGASCLDLLEPATR